MVKLKTIGDLIYIKKFRNEFQNIEIESSNFYNSGLLNYVIKYAFVALKLNGLITINSKKCNGFELTSGESFWKISRAVSKVIKEQATIIKKAEIGKITIYL